MGLLVIYFKRCLTSLVALKKQLLKIPMGYSEKSKADLFGYERFRLIDKKMGAITFLIVAESTEEIEYSGDKQGGYSFANKSSITFTQLQQKFPILKFTEIADGFQATIPANGHAIEIKLNQDITPDYNAVLEAYGKEVADAVERGEMGALGSTEPALIVSKEGRIHFGTIVQLAKKGNLGTLDHETIHMIDMLGLIPDNAWKALERKYDPKNKLSRPELEELVAEQYRKWNGQNNTVFGRIKRFSNDLYELVASPETISLYKSISDGSIFDEQDKLSEPSKSKSLND